MTSKEAVKKASRLAMVCDVLLQDGLQQAPKHLRELAKLKLTTHQWRLDAETMIEGVQARLTGLLHEQLTTVDGAAGKPKPPSVERVKQSVLCHGEYITAAQKYNRLKAVDSYVGDCIDAVNQKLSAMKAQVEVAGIEARAHIDPSPMKGTTKR